MRRTLPSLLKRGWLLSVLIGLVTSSSPPIRAAEIDVQKQLDKPVIGSQLSLSEVQAYCEQRVPPIPAFEKADDWKKYADDVRQRVLNEVVFVGEAARWRDAPTKVEWQETIDGGEGYKIKKVRYEALPGLWIPALLYEPTTLTDKMPVFLNVNGHDSAGKAASYKQTRCINQAKRGVLSLNVEWYGMGQLKSSGFTHTRINQLDLCGTSGVACHFLAMSRGIDLLLSHPNADSSRVGVAGLSGGGWQTIFISALDTRVTLTNPVAGYSSFATRARHLSDLGDSEQTPVNLGATGDYALLTAMLAPRAALLTFNATDNCCFAAPHALPPLLDAARPAYRLFGAENNLRWHVNHVPGNHNFGQENREALYRVMGDHFFPKDAKYPRHEIPSENELKKSDELRVALPEPNLDFHALALKLAETLPRLADVPKDGEKRAAWESDARTRLKKVTRAPQGEIAAAEDHRETIDGVQVTRWRLRFNDQWTIPAVDFAPKDAKSVELIIADQGRKSVASDVRRLVSEGKRVIVADLFYFGESKIASHNWLWPLMLATLGEQSLGLQASQVTAIARWAQSSSGSPVAVHALGPKNSLVALVAAGLEPKSIGHVTTNDSLTSLKQVLTDDLTVNAHPEYFCFGLLEQFDIPQLVALVGEKRVTSNSK